MPVPAARDRLSVESRQAQVETRVGTAEREIGALRENQRQYRPAVELVSKDEFNQFAQNVQQSLARLEAQQREILNELRPRRK